MKVIIFTAVIGLVVGFSAAALAQAPPPPAVEVSLDKLALTLIPAKNGAKLKVKEIMEADPVTATPEMEVNDLRRTMLESSARYLPVMQDGKLLGVISFRDVAKAVLEEQDFENKMLKGYIKNWPA